MGSNHLWYLMNFSYFRYKLSKFHWLMVGWFCGLRCNYWRARYWIWLNSIFMILVLYKMLQVQTNEDIIGKHFGAEVGFFWQTIRNEENSHYADDELLNVSSHCYWHVLVIYSFIEFLQTVFYFLCANFGVIPLYVNGDTTHISIYWLNQGVYTPWLNFLMIIIWSCCSTDVAQTTPWLFSKIMHEGWNQGGWLPSSLMHVSWCWLCDQSKQANSTKLSLKIAS